MARFETLRDLVSFMMRRKAYWLVPIIVALSAVGAIVGAYMVVGSAMTYPFF